MKKCQWIHKLVQLENRLWFPYRHISNNSALIGCQIYWDIARAAAYMSITAFLGTGSGWVRSAGNASVLEEIYIRFISCLSHAYRPPRAISPICVGLHPRLSSKTSADMFVYPHLTWQQPCETQPGGYMRCIWGRSNTSSAAAVPKTLQREIWTGLPLPRDWLHHQRRVDVPAGLEAAFFTLYAATILQHIFVEYSCAGSSRHFL